MRKKILLVFLSVGIILPFSVYLLSGSEDLIGEEEVNTVLEGDSDVYDAAWHVWWVGHALSTGLKPFFCNLIFYPQGASIMLHNIGWPDTVFIWLLNSILTGLGTAASYNFILLLGSLFTYAAAYWFFREWGLSKSTALFAALAIVWLPARTAHMLQHYTIANISYVLVSLAAFRRYIRKKTYFSLIAGGLFILISGMESLYHLPLVTVGLAGTVFISGCEWKKSIFILSTGLSAALLVIAFYAVSGVEMSKACMSWREAIVWAAEPQSFFLPSPFGLVGRITDMPYRMSWMTNFSEGVVTPGLSIVVLMILGAIRTRKWKLIAVVIGISLFALGPELRLLGRPLGIPLPFRLFQLIPGVTGLRAPSRFALICGIFSVLAAFITIEGFSIKTRLITGGVVFFELLVPVFPVIDSSVPAVYEEIAGTGPVLELPVVPLARRYIYFQTVDENPRFLAYLARPPGIDFSPDLDILMFDSGKIITESDLEATGAMSVIYNRWLFPDSQTNYYDSLYTGAFPDGQSCDSVWIWTR